MKWSRLAAEIDNEYRIMLKWKEIKRQTCIVDKEKQCYKCPYKAICENNEEQAQTK